MEYMLKTTLVPRFGGKTSCDEIGLPVSATGCLLYTSQMLLRDCKAAVKVYPIEPEEYRVVGLAVQRPASMAPAVEQMFHHLSLIHI